ncbi:AAA family ATPase [candidate division KSB1 bacterium]|nr:AAA family ATPase [candidate division KSB1 bacterium]RQW01617.1 MAG: AAA family ATPase [candidate division KSB1 bacterium]
MSTIENSKTPSPEELRNDVSNFLRNKYGDRVIIPPEAERFGNPPGERNNDEKPLPHINFDLKPTELEAYLNEYVVGQQEAVEVLATKIATHFNRMKYETSNSDIEALVGNIKSNVLMIGPTGVGKTYLIKLIAKKIGVPFVKGDATKFSETGYVGGDVDDLVRNLVHEANGEIRLAEYGIIYLDEIDKIASSGNGFGPDVSRSGVQRNLLKLMEEGEVDLKVPHDLASQMEAAMQAQRTGKVERKKINTKNILFVTSGAFFGLTDIIRKRLNQQPMGFTNKEADVRKMPDEDIFKMVRSEDLIKFGFETEFVGRLPVVVSLNGLDVEGLYQILKNPNSTVILGKKRDLKAYGIDIEFDDAALRRIAELAFEEHTGARGLTSVVDRLLLKYEKLLPDTDLDHIVITREIVENSKAELERILTNYYIKSFQKRFLVRNNIVITFTKDAIELLQEMSRKKGKNIDDICSDLLTDYEYGLKLLNWEEFIVNADIIKNPKERLEELIKKSYEKK